MTLAGPLILLTTICLGAHIADAQSPTIVDGAAHATASGAARKGGDVARKGVQRGKVSWYGRRFAGRKTASGERFDPQALTMAHRSLPLGAVVDVTNNANGRHVRLRVNDRGPYHGNRVADLSRAASERLGFVDSGVTEATIRVVSLPNDATAG
jgi:rare lipoprotein A